MTPERWQQIKALFAEAVARAPSERAAFLENACGGDAALRQEVEALLACDEGPADFMETPAVADGAEVLLAHDREPPMVGRRIGPYQVIREIGQGGMGTVYLAERTDGIRKQVAIKLIKRGMDTDAILRRFRHEQQILATLDHPNITKFLDGGTTDDGQPYVIMDYVEGLPVDVYCDTHRLSVAARLALFRTICSAIEHAHQHRVVHRDLKPSNILVTPDGTPKLLDFGIAKVLHPEPSSQTADPTGALRLMTPDYASPEQVRGEPVTPSSDIYSLGVLLYELLTGHRPYRVTSPTLQAIERAISDEELERPSTVISRIEEAPRASGIVTLTPESVSETREGRPEALRRRLAGDLDNIVLTALRKEPARRYISVEQFSEDIRRHLDGLPVIARKDALGYRSARFIKRNKSGVLAALSAGVIVLVLVVAGFYGLSRRGEERATDSLAVLPFVNASADPDMEYLSDGITETLINSLAQLPKLRVLPSSTVFHYRGREVASQQVGRDLNVRAVLVGKVQPHGDTLIIHTELVDVSSGAQLWGQNYRRKLEDLLSVQEDIAREIAEKLRRQLGVEQKTRLSKRATESPEAYRLYLMGHYYLGVLRGGTGYQKALEYFQQAIAKDPKYALAYTGIADAYLWLGDVAGRPPREAFPAAKEAALRALALDEQLVEARISLALVKTLYDWDWAGAERELQRALALNPEYANAHVAHGDLLSILGQHEAAIAEKKRAQGLEPLAFNTRLEWDYFRARQYDRAIEEARRMIEKKLEMDSNVGGGYDSLLGLAYEQKGQYEEAIGAFQKALESGKAVPRLVAWLAHAYAAAGQRVEARQQLAEAKELSKRFYLSYSIAAVHAALGEKDQAFEWLDRAYKEHESTLVVLKVDPRVDPLRSDPRFADLVRRVGLPP